MYQNLALLTAFVFLYSLTSKGLERTPFNGAILFTAFGLAFGPFGLGFLNLSLDFEGSAPLLKWPLPWASSRTRPMRI
jgi:hypothetical protein